MLTLSCMEKMLKRQSDVKSNAAGNIAKAQAKQKETYDKRHSPEVSNIVKHKCAALECR